MIEYVSEGGATPTLVCPVIPAPLLGARGLSWPSHGPRGVKYRMMKPAVLKVKYRNNTGGDTGEIAISPIFLGTSEEKGEYGTRAGRLQHVSSPSSSLLVWRGTSPQFSAIQYMS